MAHEPSIQFAAEPSTRCWVCRNFLEKGINFIQATARGCNVTVGHLDNMINDTDNVPFEERMPDKTHQVFLAIAARWARAPAVTSEASPTGSH